MNMLTICDENSPEATWLRCAQNKALWIWEHRRCHMFSAEDIRWMEVYMPPIKGVKDAN